MKGWHVNYATLPHKNKVVKGLNRIGSAVVLKGKDKVLYDRPPHGQKIIGEDLNVDYEENNDDKEIQIAM
eukprot:6681980-Ditylum_brightwellii.AAC.1